MKLLKLLVCGLLVFTLQHSNYAEGYYLGLGVGGGGLKIDQDLFPGLTNENDESNDTLVVDVLVGREFSNGVLIDIGIESYSELDFFGLGDSLDFSTTRLGIGYVIPSESRFKAYGKTGVNFWDLTFTEGPLFNPGPEESAETSGEDLFLQVGFEYHFNAAYRLGLSFDYSNVDEVDATAVKLGFKWFFSGN